MSNSAAPERLARLPCGKHEPARQSFEVRLDPDTTKHWFKRVLPLVRQFDGLSLLVLAFSIGAIIFQVAIPALLGASIDVLEKALSKGVREDLYHALLLLISAGIARSVMNFSVRFTLFKLTYAVEASLCKLIHRHLDQVPIAFVNRYRIGQLISRASSDVRAIQSFLLYFPYIAMVFGTFAFSIVYMFVVDMRLALVAIASLPGVFLLSLRLRTVMYPFSWLVQSRMADVAAVVDENLRGHEAVKLFVNELLQIRILQEAATRLHWATRAMIRYRAMYAPLIENFAELSQIAILMYGGWLVMRGEILLGQFVAFNVYLVMMLVPFRTLGQVLILGRNASAAAARVFEILDAPPEATAQALRAVKLESGDTIELDQVQYHVSTSSARDEHPLLDCLSTSIQAGRITAIVGRTGSGKSTIANLLLGFVKPDSGKIRIGGVPMDELDLHQLRRGIAMVPQESFLFADTILNNIRFGAPDASVAEVMEAARLADAHDFILAQPNGYDTMVGEAGVTLSGGQRQRITIAQSVLANPSLLVLDDATSALDSVTEAQVMAAIKRRFTGRTILIISHRASMAQHADEVQLLHAGKIVSRGTHEQLMATEPLYTEVFVQEESKPGQPLLEKESDADYYRRLRNAVSGAAMAEVNIEATM